MIVIGGKFQNRRIAVPKGDQTRPTSARLRETFFNIVQHEIEGACFLDIFAGSGAMGLEAMSRGARNATFIESSRHALVALKANQKRFDVISQTTILFGDYLKMLKKLKNEGKQFDLIFADPPYHMDIFKSLLNEVSEGSLLKKEGSFFMENDQATLKFDNLEGLHFIKSRRSGKTFLHQFGA